jgi:5-hydroxyisourate hydrolase
MSATGAITSHVLDLGRGRPADGVPVRLDRRDDAGWRELASAVTDADGRVRELLAAGVPLAAGVYRLTFELAAYFAAHGVDSFYPEAVVVFEVRRPAERHHVPLLVAPHGYSTYRGS